MLKYATFFGGIFLLALFFISPRVFAADQSFIINEIMYDYPGSDKGHEWVELKNIGSSSVTITSTWRFYDTSNHLLTLSQGSATIQPDGYVVLANDPATFLADNPNFCGTIFKSALSLGNTSGSLKVSNDSGKSYFAQIDYSSAQGAAGDGNTLELEGGNFRSSYIVGGTPGKENSIYIPPPPKEFPESVTKYFDMSKINNSEVTVTEVIDGDTIKVNLDGEEQLVRLIGVDSPESSVNSLFKIDEPFYYEATEFAKTKLLNNKINLLISADEFQRYDQYGRLLAAVVINEELFNIQLIKNGLARTYFLENELIKSPEWIDQEAVARDNQSGIWQGYGISDVIINEIIPNPTGSDSENEWIELYNRSDHDIDISNWFLDDEENGSKPCIFPKETILHAEGYLVIPITDSKISLNNDGDRVRMFKPDLTMVEEIGYSEAIEGESYSRFDDNWLWTDVPSKGNANVPHQITNNNPVSDSQNTNNKLANFSITNSIKEAKKLPNDAQISIIGVVSVLPGILSSQYFYIQDNEAGVQIYSYYKKFPLLSVGDKIKVSGILSGNEVKRIKITQPENIGIIEKNIEIDPKLFSISQINHDTEGQLVKITGEIIKLSGGNIYLKTEDSQIIVQIRKSTGFNKPPVKKGDILEIVGIVYQSNDKFYILPRFPDDIKVTQSVQADIKTNIKTKSSGKNNLIMTAYAANNSMNKGKVSGMQDSSLNDILYKNKDYLSLINNYKSWTKIPEFAIISTIVLLILWIIEWLWPRQFQKV